METVTECCDLPARMKWPNDVVLDSDQPRPGKLAGLLAALKSLGLDKSTDVFVTADHGFSTIAKRSETSVAARDEAAGGPLGVFEPAAAAAHGLGDALDGFVLADDAVVQILLHLHQAQGVFGGHPRERDAGHLGNHFGNDFLVDNAAVLARFFTPFLGDLLLLFLELVGLIAQRRSLLDYLNRSKSERYKKVIDKLNLRK